MAEETFDFLVEITDEEKLDVLTAKLQRVLSLMQKINALGGKTIGGGSGGALGSAAGGTIGAISTSVTTALAAKLGDVVQDKIENGNKAISQEVGKLIGVSSSSTNVPRLAGPEKVARLPDLSSENKKLIDSMKKSTDSVKKVSRSQVIGRKYRENLRNGKLSIDSMMEFNNTRSNSIQRIAKNRKTGKINESVLGRKYRGLIKEGFTSDYRVWRTGRAKERIARNSKFGQRYGWHKMVGLLHSNIKFLRDRNSTNPDFLDRAVDSITGLNFGRGDLKTDAIKRARQSVNVIQPNRAEVLARGRMRIAINRERIAANRERKLIEQVNRDNPFVESAVEALTPEDFAMKRAGRRFARRAARSGGLGSISTQGMNKMFARGVSEFGRPAATTLLKSGAGAAVKGGGRMIIGKIGNVIGGALGAVGGPIGMIVGGIIGGLVTEGIMMAVDKVTEASEALTGFSETVKGLTKNKLTKTNFMREKWDDLSFWEKYISPNTTRKQMRDSVQEETKKRETGFDKKRYADDILSVKYANEFKRFMRA
jgi:hypothetical protein